jgi:ureidoglycolate lyase
VIELSAQPLTREAFATFGEVIELDGARQITINDGLTTRFHDLCKIDVSDDGGYAIVNVFRSAPLPLPHRVRVMERHPLGSQAFIPVDDLPFLVLVATDVNPVSASDLTLFVTNGRQGINIHKNTWHHFQIVLGKRRDFIVIDRGGGGDNLEEIAIEDEVWIPDSVQES